MDAFFASVEQREQPSLINRPVIVGGSPDSRGVVAACSYEARKFGIHSAMPTATAKKLCPDAIFLQPNFELYKSVSEQMHQIFEQYTDNIEPISLDEAYLDVTDTPLKHNSATLMAQEIQKQIHDALSLSASAGISYNKFLAKMASDQDKPHGITTIEPGQGQDFVAKLPIGKFHGIGKATEQKMRALGIKTGKDLRAWPEDKLVEHFGKAGHHFYQVARGEDNREVESSRTRKSVGHEVTFANDILDPFTIRTAILELSDSVCKRLNKLNMKAKRLTLKVKYADFQQVTRSCTLRNSVSSPQPILELLPYLLAKTDAGETPVRLLGVTLSNLSEASQNNTPEQLSFEF